MNVSSLGGGWIQYDEFPERASMPCDNGGRDWDIAAASQGTPIITMS